MRGLVIRVKPSQQFADAVHISLRGSLHRASIPHLERVLYRILGNGIRLFVIKLGHVQVTGPNFRWLLNVLIRHAEQVRAAGGATCLKNTPPLIYQELHRLGQAHLFRMAVSERPPSGGRHQVA